MTLQGNAGEVVRFNIQLSVPINNKLEELRDHLGATSKAEIIRRSIQVMHILMENQEAGGKIVMYGPDNIEERIVIS